MKATEQKARLPVHPTLEPRALSRSCSCADTGPIMGPPAPGSWCRKRKRALSLHPRRGWDTDSASRPLRPPGRCTLRTAVPGAHDWCPRPYPACQSPLCNESLVPTWAVHYSHTRDLTRRTHNRGAQTGDPFLPLSTLTVHTPGEAGESLRLGRSEDWLLSPPVLPGQGLPGSSDLGRLPCPCPKQPSAQHQRANPAGHCASPLPSASCLLQGQA